MLKYIVIHPADNVAVALQPLEEGESITCGSTAVKVREQVPANPVWRTWGRRSA